LLIVGAGAKMIARRWLPIDGPVHGGMPLGQNLSGRQDHEHHWKQEKFFISSSS
jgi:hypothetical protein